MKSIEDVSIEGLDIEAILDVLSAFDVSVALLYGSYARDEKTPSSDIDIAIDFESSHTSQERTQIRLQLIERLSSTLGTNEIDVIPLDQAPTELRSEILQDGVLLTGERKHLERYEGAFTDSGQTTHEERMQKFDSILTDLEQLV
jgi:predicted nucleotidyltransferase